MLALVLGDVVESVRAHGLHVATRPRRAVRKICAGCERQRALFRYRRGEVGPLPHAVLPVLPRSGRCAAMRQAGSSRLSERSRSASAASSICRWAGCVACARSAATRARASSIAIRAGSGGVTAARRCSRAARRSSCCDSTALLSNPRATGRLRHCPLILDHSLPSRPPTTRSITRSAFWRRLPPWIWQCAEGTSSPALKYSV
jgi:hypothetical protein